MIFLSCPYTDPLPNVVEERVSKTKEFVAKHMKEGQIIIAPIVYGHTILQEYDLPSTWAFWHDFCKEFIEASEELWVLQVPGWESSTGVSDEIRMALDKGIPVKYVDPS